MNIAFVFGLKNKKSFGGAERRLSRIYNEICADNDDLKCDIVICGCDINTALALFRKADCDVANINHIYAFGSRLKFLLYVLFLSKYKIIHFFGLVKQNKLWNFLL